MGKSPVVQAVLLSRISIPTNSNDITWAETRVVEKTEGGGECHTGAPSQSPPQLGILASLAAIDHNKSFETITLHFSPSILNSLRLPFYICKGPFCPLVFSVSSFDLPPYFVLPVCLTAFYFKLIAQETSPPPSESPQYNHFRRNILSSLRSKCSHLRARFILSKNIFSHT
jgi:hypothetical protein